MRYTWLDEYLMRKPSVTKNTENWNWVRYMIGGKMFVAICLDDHDAPYYITLKLDPIEGEFFRKQYEDIVPGFYMNKIHWNSIKPDGNVPDDLLKTFVDKSYQLILKSFSKKMQQEILSGAQQ
ncbi:MAG: MmcQ/YjbR family DNA-binding protein [Clostridiales bacterium]|nr:MmcQ/YjbR family DNA-binding protein [Clostridiales bacterium]